MGLDLASVSDITSLALAFKHEDGIHLEAHHWLPQAAIDRRLAKDETSIYGQLHELPNVHITPGNATDYEAIRKFITGNYMEGGKLAYNEDNLMLKYNIKTMAYDRYNSSQIIIQLAQDGLECVPMGQGYGSMSQPTKELERMVLDGELTHDDCPLLNWMLGNVIIEMNHTGDVRCNKAKSGDKIDGIVAGVMSVSEYLHSFIEEEKIGLSDNWKPRFL